MGMGLEWVMLRNGPAAGMIVALKPHDLVHKVRWLGAPGLPPRTMSYVRTKDKDDEYVYFNWVEETDGWHWA